MGETGSTSEYLKALLLEKNGDWDQAHRIVQELHTKEAAWIHAYLHRKEGDEWNANYWCQRAGKTFCKLSLEEEWEFLFQNFSKK